ncbi:MAG: protein kinase [Polyangia bacterium]
MSDALTVERILQGDVLCLRLAGVIDERFEPATVFGELPPFVLIDLAGIKRITSFGVRQWSDAMKAVPPSVQHLYVLRAPACFVDQLNMVLNFGGRLEVVSATALYFCERCQEERAVAIDVLEEHALLASGAAPTTPCPTCGTPMALEDDPQQAFRYVGSYGAKSLAPETTLLLAQESLYHPRRIGPPPEETKLVHGDVTLLVLSGTLDQRFRPRRLSSGVEGDVVLDLGGVASMDATGVERFRQLLTALESARSLTIVDATEPLLRHIASGGLPLGRATLYSTRLTFQCAACGADSRVSLSRSLGPSHRPPCRSCGEQTLLAGAGPWLDRVFRGDPGAPPSDAVVALIGKREELVSRARAESHTRSDAPAGTLGRYRVLRPLSRGGMAEILLAVHEGIGGFEKLIALKKIRRQLLERRKVAVELFLNEAKIVANLNHPNIVQTFEVGEHAGDLFIAMEYVHGVDARTVVKRRATQTEEVLSLAHVLYIGTQVAAALDHAHTALDLTGRPLQIVHRDVSLSNVVLGFDGQVKLVDFGIATAASVEAPGETKDSLVGKFSYMSPEQIRQEPLDGRSDVFSLGIALYELITGRPLFRRGTDQETLEAVASAAVPSLAAHGVEREVEDVLLHALTKDRGARYADARAFELALHGALQSLGGMSAHQLSVRMRELFPVESAAAPTAVRSDAIVGAQAPPDGSGPSISAHSRSSTFPGQMQQAAATPSVSADSTKTPPSGTPVLDRAALAVFDPPPADRSDRRGEGVHFNRGAAPLPLEVAPQAAPQPDGPKVLPSGTLLLVVLLILLVGGAVLWAFQ